MTVHAILKMGDPRLLRQAELVTEFDTPELHSMIADMMETMHAAGGVGLAAPQIGINLQLVLFGFKKSERYPDAPPVPETILINPVLTPLSENVEDGWEGCLSVPGMRGLVPRWTKLRYSGFDQWGKKIERVVEDFHARVVQHECDHLFGLLYPMRMSDLSHFGFTEVLFPELDAADDD